MALRSGALFFLLLVACALPAGAGSLTRDELQKFLDSTVHAWRFQLGEVPGAEAPGFDDSQWWFDVPAAHLRTEFWTQTLHGSSRQTACLTFSHGEKNHAIPSIGN